MGSNGLVAWYPFDGNADDISSVNNDGVVYGPTPTTDRFGNPSSALLFDGFDDSLVIQHVTEFDNFFQNDFTISIWASSVVPGISTGYILYKGENYNSVWSGPVNEDSPLFLYSDGSFSPFNKFFATQPTLNCLGGSFRLKNDDIITNAWYHLILVKRNDQLFFYVNGNLEGQDFYPGTCYGNVFGPLRVGHRGSANTNTQSFFGKIDDLKIYNRSLSPCEVNQLFTLNLDNGLVAHYPLDGNTLDVSGNNHHGTNQGATFALDRNNNPNSAASFDGIDDHIGAGTIINVANQSAMSISAWFYPEPAVNSQVNRFAGVSFGTKLTGELALRMQRDDLRRFQGLIASGSPQSSSGNNTSALSGFYNNSQWYHVAATYEDQKVRIYINGQFVSENSGGNGSGGVLSHVQSNASLWIGRAFNTFNDSKFYRGRLDDIRIYNRIINDCEIAELFQPGTVSANVSTVQACVNDSVSLVSSLDSVTWTSNSGQFLGFGDSIDFEYSNQPYVLATGLNFCGCLQSDTVFIQTKAQPTYSLRDTIIICPNVIDTVSITTNPSNSVLWSNGSLFIDSTQQNPLINPINNPDTIPIFQKVYVQITDQNSGCIENDSTILRIRRKPIYSLFDPGFVCSPDTLQFLDISGPGSNWTAISWNASGGIGIAFVNSPPRIISNNPLTSDRNVELRVQITDTSGCLFYDTAQFIQFRRIIIDAGEDTLLCNSDTVLLGSDNDSQYLYQWTPSTNLNSDTIARPTFFYPNSVTNSLNFSYSLEKRHILSQCAVEDQVDLTINKRIDVFAGNDTALCSQATIHLGENSQTGFTYLWQGSDSISSFTDADPLFTYFNPDSSAAMVQLVSTATDTATGCSISDLIDILIKPQIFINAGQNITFCGSDSVGIGSLNDSRYAYSWFPSNGLIDPNADTTIISLDNFSDSLQGFKYFLNASFDGCSESDSIDVIVNPKPFDDLSGPNIVCPGVDSAEYFVGRPFTDYSYSWFIDGGNISVNSNDSVVVAWDTTNFNAFIGQYPTNSFGCVGDTFIWNVRINPLLIPEIETDTIVYCEREKNIQDYNILFPIVNSSYTWFVEGGQVVSGQGSDVVRVAWDSIGFGQIWVAEENITNIDSCFGTSDTLLIQVLRDPILDSIQGQFDICDFGDTLLFSTQSDLSGSIFWSSDSVSQIVGNSQGDSVLITSTNDGDYTVQVFTLSDDGCFSDTLSQNVNIRYLQTPEIEVDTQVYCFDDSLFIDFEVADFYQTSTYNWSVSSGQIIQGQGQRNIRLYVPQADTIEILVDEVNSLVTDTCFTVSDTLQIIVHPYPISNQIFGTLDFCDQQDSIWYFANGDTNSTYYWSSDSFSQILSGTDKDSILISFPGDGDINIQVYEENIYGCFGDTLSETVNIRFLQIPVIDFDTNQVCFWDSTDFKFRVRNEYDSSEYQWVSSHGQIFSGQGEREMILRVFQPDTIRVFVSEVNNAVEDSCFGISDTIEVYIYPRPERDLSILGPDTLCFSQNCTWYNYPGWEFSSFSWNTDAGICNTLLNKDSLEIGFAVIGEYNLSVVETSEFGCLGDTVYQGIEVFPNPVTEIVSNDSIICPTDQLGRVYGLSGYDFSEFIWSVQGGTIQSGQGTDLVIINWDDTIDLQLSAYEITFADCTSDTVSFPLFTDNMRSVISSVSLNEDFTELIIDGNSDLAVFNPNDTLFLYAGESLPGYSSQKEIIAGNEVFNLDSIFGTQVFYYQYIAINACNDTLTSEIHNNIVLNVQANEQQNRFQLEWNPYEAWRGNVMYEILEWKPGQAPERVEISNVEYFEFINEERRFEHCYFIEAENPNRPGLLSRSNLACIEFERPLKLPDVVTSNGDGYNDFFVVENIHLYPEHRLEIYSRSGRPIFNTSDYQNDWPPESLPAGVYFYRFTLEEGINDFAGYIHLIR